MPWKSFSNGVPLPDGDLNNQFMNQVVAQMTSTSRVPSPVAGQFEYLTDTDDLRYYDGTVDRALFTWKAYTPTLTAASSNPTNFAATGRYWKFGRAVMCTYKITANSSPAFTHGTGTYAITLPVPAANSGDFAGWAQASRSGASFPFSVHVGSTTATFLVVTAYGGGRSTVDNATPWTWAAGDVLEGFLTYESAS